MATEAVNRVLIITKGDYSAAFKTLISYQTKLRNRVIHNVNKKIDWKMYDQYIKKDIKDFFT